MAEERLADLDGYVERSEAAQRALEERLASDGIEDLQRHIAAALEETGEAQSAALDQAAKDWLERMEKDGRKNGSKLRRRAAPGATAVVLAIAAALGGTMFLRSGGSDRPSVASANPPAHRAAPPKSVPTGDASQVSQVADALSNISWPSTTMAPLSWRAPGTSSASAPGGAATTGTSSANGAEAPASGGGGGGQAAPAQPAPTQLPPTSPPSTQPPPPTLLPPITLPSGLGSIGL
jgi:hypothetical protein